MRSLTSFGGLMMSALLAWSCAGAAKPGPEPLSAGDRAAIDSVQRRYVSAWLRDDTVGVLATLAPDAMLLPPGLPPVVGEGAIRDHWWPRDGSHTTITAFTLSSDEVDGGGSFAYSRGLSTLAWTYSKDGATQSQSGRNIGLTIFRRMDDGRWLIHRQMWGPSLSP